MYSIAIFMKQYIWKTILAANKLGNIIYYHERLVLFQHLLTTYWLLRHYLDTKLKLSTWFSFCNFVRDINIILIILNFNAWPQHGLHVTIFSFIYSVLELTKSSKIIFVKVYHNKKKLSSFALLLQIAVLVYT